MKIKNVYNIEKFIAKSNSHVVNMLAWHSLRLYLNISLPIFYKCSRIQKKKKRSEYTDKKVIVSMTTFPARMKTLSIVLESLFRQTVFPDEIILWLADEQFSDHEQVEKVNVYKDRVVYEMKDGTVRLAGDLSQNYSGNTLVKRASVPTELFQYHMAS